MIAVVTIFYWASKPPLPIPPAIMPTPNAYDDFMAAGKLSADTKKIGYAIMVNHITKRHEDRTYTLQEKTKMLQENRQALMRVRIGLTHECGNPLSRTVDLGLSEQQPFLSLSRLFTLEYQVCGASGNHSAAMKSCLDQAQFGAVLINDCTYVDVSRGMRFQRVSFAHGWDELPHLNARSAANAALRLEQIDRATIPFVAMRAEQKWAGLTLIQQAMIPPNRRQDPIAQALQRLNERRFADDMDRLIQKASTPWSTLVHDVAPKKQNAVYIMANLLEIDDHNGYQYFHTAAKRRLFLTALALKAYRDDTGAYPTSISQLTPRYLTSVPIDPFSSQANPLQYKRNGAAYLLYSVGPDAKDNGGKAAQYHPTSNQPLTAANRYLIGYDSVGDIVAGVNK
ncbi:MAG: hypothetical protein ABIY70_20095 [Capsulimonas sp.]|uniref:hypothetical protein n=1 Tax=Capsulimonas sp. TaxID=2494211 RepID=UPI0032679D38